MGARQEAEIVACIPSLRRYARGLTADAARADDLVQDTLEHAWRRLSMWRRQGELRAWLFGIMHNVFIDSVRARRLRDTVHDDDAIAAMPVRAQQSDGLEVRDLDRLLQRLNPDVRAVLLLVTVEELTYQEAARALDVPVGTIMSRLSRGRERLAAMMAGREPVTPLRRVK